MKANGFSVIEVLVATAIVMAGVATLARIFLVSADAAHLANGTSIAALLAEQKMEELRAAPGSLGVSPGGALATDTAGFVEYLDASGGLLAGPGTETAPLNTIYVRRWSVGAFTGAANNAAILQVFVMPKQRARAGNGIVRLVSVRREREG